MATITIENVPQNIVEQYWKIISFEKVKNNFNVSKITYWNDKELNNLWKTSTVFSNSF